MTIASKISSSSLPEIDSLYVYQTAHKARFTRHLNRNPYRYVSNKAVLVSDEVYDYHQTVEIKGIKHGLTLITKNGKYREVQRWFKEQIQAIEDDEKLFDKFRHAKATPTELGLRYVY